jgi:isocitrate dehydrogenase
MYWAEAIANQDQNPTLKAKFAALAEQLRNNQALIVAELNGAQGKAIDIGGYYHPDPIKASRAMRPSETLNRAMAAQ